MQSAQVCCLHGARGGLRMQNAAEHESGSREMQTKSVSIPMGLLNCGIKQVINLYIKWY